MEPVKILWTGGWDSTFRLLELTQIPEILIQPLYMKDGERESLPIEMQAMDAIRVGILQRYPDCGARLLPTRYFEKNAIVRNADIRDKYQKLQSQYHVAAHYESLAHFVHQMDMSGVEMCVSRDSGGFYGFLGENCISREEPPLGKFHILSPDVPDTWPISVFRRFRFPIMGVTRAEMRDKAEEAGVLDILSLAWFCSEPINREPCGLCENCREIVQQGMKYRLPAAARRRYGMRWFYRHRAST